ncbi:hypothetical protein LTR85_002153 [Meristemomyces frigidus]|nr:hypothetical protein LTR85_002153 [Meristemomyces frigidus]
MGAGIRVAREEKAHPAQQQQAHPPQTTPASVPTQHEPSAPTWDLAQFERMVQALPEHQVRRILLFASQNSAYIQAAVPCMYNINKRKEAARVVNFRHHMQDVEYILNEKYRSNSGSREYEMAGDAVHDIEEIIRKIEKEAHPELSCSNKLRALETLLDIGHSVVDAPSSTLGSEVSKSFQRDYRISAAMCSILNSMSVKERQDVAGSENDDNGLPGKVEGLESSADGYDMTMDMDKVLELLSS